MSRRIRVREPRVRGPRAGAVLLVLLAAAGCARKQMPSGGPPDTTPPRVLEVSPDSGATGVSRTIGSFSFGMSTRG